MLITPIQTKKYEEFRPTSHPRPVFIQKQDTFVRASNPIAFKSRALEIGLELQREAEKLFADNRESILKEANVKRKVAMIGSFMQNFDAMQTRISKKLNSTPIDTKTRDLHYERKHEIFNYIAAIDWHLVFIPKKNSHEGLPKDLSSEKCNELFNNMQDGILNTIRRYNFFFVKGLDKNTMHPKTVFDIAHDYASEYAKGKGVNIVFEGKELLSKHPDGISMVLGSRLEDYHLYTILSNLMQNGVKYTKDGSTVNVKIAEQVVDDCKYLTFSVRDEGIGIPKESQEKVLEGERAKNAIDAGVPGTGYGLRRIKSILELTYCQHKTLEINSPLNPENAQYPGAEITAFLRLKD